MALVYATLAVLGTWILNLLFRKWFDLVLWPRLVDWWASLSERRLREKISSLQYTLSKPPTGEDIILYGLERLFTVLMFLMANLLVLAMLPRLIMFAPYIGSPTMKDRSTIDFFCYAQYAVFGFAFLFGMWSSTRLSSKRRKWKYYGLYKPQLEKRLADLQKRLACKYGHAPVDGVDSTE